MKNNSKTNKPKTIRKINANTPRIMLAKTISDFCGKDERRLMFRTMNNRLYMFVINSKSIGKIHLKEKPKTYLIKNFENISVFLYKLNKEKQVK